MLKTNLFLLCSFLLILPSSIYSQNLLEGTWTVKCVTEKIDPQTMQFDNLCQYAKVDKLTLRMIDYEVQIDDKVIKIEEGDEYKSVEYSYDADKNWLKFRYKDEDHAYRVLQIMQSDDLILKNEEGTVLVLEKAESN